MLASAELRRCKQEHAGRLNLNAAILANFLSSLGEREESLRLQRKRDAEVRKVQEKIEDASVSHSKNGFTQSSNAGSTIAATPGALRDNEEAPYRIVKSEGDPGIPETSSLKLYEDY